LREVDALELIETLREGLLVLEPDLTVRFANRAFCNTFAVVPENTVGRKLYELGDGQWDIPELRALLETILPEPRRSRLTRWIAYSRQLDDG
jgi:PAS domain-containing protein